MEHDVTTLVANILIGIGLGIGLVVFWIWHTVRKFEGEMRGIVREAIQEVEAQMLGVVVEEDGGQLYFYRETDRQFLCQGASLAEVRKRFNELYPEKIAFLAGGDPALMERLKAELAEIKKQETNESSIKV
jgi:hypothetical protein